MKKKKPKGAFRVKVGWKSLNYEEMGHAIKVTEAYMVQEHREWIALQERAGTQGMYNFLLYFSFQLHYYVVAGRFLEKGEEISPLFFPNLSFLVQVGAWVLQYEDHVFSSDIPWKREEMIEAIKKKEDRYE